MKKFLINVLTEVLASIGIVVIIAIAFVLSPIWGAVILYERWESKS